MLVQVRMQIQPISGDTKCKLFSLAEVCALLIAILVTPRTGSESGVKQLVHVRLSVVSVYDHHFMIEEQLV